MHNSLRMRPDRIILGEVRGGEAVEMIQAMALRLSDRQVAWLVASTVEPSDTEPLTLVAPGSPGGARRLGGVPYPFTAPATAIAAEDDELLVLGAEYRPDLFLRSLLLRLSTSCT